MSVLQALRPAFWGGGGGGGVVIVAVTMAGRTKAR